MSTQKPKMTMASVRGRIIVRAEDGERIGPWGGTECFLSRQTGLGPCLVVRSSRHKRHEGTFFRLVGLQRVLSAYATAGKLTVVVPHERRVCTVFIETSSDVDELRIMAAVLQDRGHWKNIEKNVACRKGQESRGSVAKSVIGLRDPGAFCVPEWDDDDDDGDKHRESGACEMTPRGAEGVASSPAAAVCEPPLAASVSLLSGAFDGVVATIPMGTQTVKKAGAGVAAMTAAPGISWTAEQVRATQLVRDGRNVFVTGSAGTGKTAWLLHVIHHVLPRDQGTVVTATTGIAARLLGGSTLHAFAGVGRGEGEPSRLYDRVASRPEVVREWRQCKTLVIDEVGVLQPDFFSLLDGIARHVRNLPEKPFGGIQLLLLGDFLQLPPVAATHGVVAPAKSDDGGQRDEDAKWCFECPLWDMLQLTVVEFRRSYRHESDPKFAACMEDIRLGRYTQRVESVLSACLNRRLGERYGVTPTMIMSRRQDVDAYNTKRLQQLESVYFHRYESEDYASTPGTDLDREVSLLPRLELRVGAQVVLLASLPDVSHLSNGDLGVVVSFVEQTHGAALPVVCFASSSGEEVVVPRVRMEVLGADGRVAATRTQIPLQLAWAMTVHRVQGMTLPMVSVKLDSSFFAPGQAYVALSRARRQEDVALLSLDASAIRADAKAVAFYEKLRPRHSQQQTTRTTTAAAVGVNDDGELVKLRRCTKRPRSCTGDNIGNDGTELNDEGLLDCQVGGHLSSAEPPAKQDALKLLAASGSAIPQLTQESDAGDSTWPLLQLASQRSLLMDDE